MDVFQKNVIALKQKSPQLYQTVVNRPQGVMKSETITARTGEVSLRVECHGRKLMLHSCVDPVKEAGKWLKGQDITEADAIIFYGVGLGYHVRLALEMTSGSIPIWVFQLGIDLFNITLHTADISDLLANNRVEFVISDEVVPLKNALVRVLADFDPEKIRILPHKPSLQLIKDGGNHLRELLEEWSVKMDSIHRFSPIAYHNFRQNERHLHGLNPIQKLFGELMNVPLFLVSGGPSLDDELGNMKEVQKRGFILSVGTAVRPLLNIGVEPDLIIITDPQDIAFHQVEGLNLKIPLIILPTVSPRFFSDYQGPKHLALQRGLDYVEKYAEENNLTLIESGGSVVTTALEIAILMGGNPIVFIGMDFAYSKGKTHARGTIYGDIRLSNRNLRLVMNNLGEPVATGKNLTIYKKWVETRIQKETDRLFINTALTGARIEGTKAEGLTRVLDKLPAIRSI